jgi:hypothetical protein
MKGIMGIITVVHSENHIKHIHVNSLCGWMESYYFYPAFLILNREREADHSPPTSAEVKKMWIYTSTSPSSFMVKCLIS